jgi:diguanylate cyclase (GGDEF)-like protein
MRVPSRPIKPKLMLLSQKFSQTGEAALKFLRAIHEFLSVPADKPELVLSQVHAYSRQIPLLYLVLLSNSFFVASTHLRVAPASLTILFPLAMAAVALWRIIGWWRMRHSSPSAEDAVIRLKSTMLLAGILGIAFTAWGLSLYPYGGAFQKAHVAFYMSITMIACVFCLMHLRAAAFILALVVMVPFAFVLSMTGNTVMLLIAMNLVLVTGAMLFVLSNHYEDFATMVAQKVDLEATNRRTLMLSDENHRLANHDTLTGLPNRRNFFNTIEAQIKSADGRSKGFAVGLIDLDGFKAVNDLYGHAFGDHLLIEAGRRMQAEARSGIFIARLGGDEFGFITEDADAAFPYGEAMCAALAAPYHLDEVTVDAGGSCGVARYETGVSSASQLLEHADYALYQAKTHAAGRAVHFNGEHLSQLRRKHVVGMALRSADLEGEMRLVYQPIVDHATGCITAFEALARWRSPSLGAVNPQQFIIAAERSPLINKLTLVLLKHLLRDMAQWPPHVAVSFNLSARNFASSETMIMILAAIEASGINPKRIDFEVTETALMVDFEAALRSLSMLRNLGASIALDDFGAGYSSLSYVHELPLDKIKIDRAFIAEATRSERTRKIVKSILSLSRNLKLACVAEGVETKAQARVLSELGCTLMQGYLFSGEIEADKVPAAISKRRLGMRNRRGA